MAINRADTNKLPRHPHLHLQIVYLDFKFAFCIQHFGFGADVKTLLKGRLTELACSLGWFVDRFPSLHTCSYQDGLLYSLVRMSWYQK